MYKKQIKCILFLILGITLFCTLRQLFMPKWYFPDSTMKEPTSRILTGIYDEPKETIDTVFLGTSHMIYGAAPMELYEKYGIKSYMDITVRRSRQSGVVRATCPD